MSTNHRVQTRDFSHIIWNFSQAEEPCTADPEAHGPPGPQQLPATERCGRSGFEPFLAGRRNTDPTRLQPFPTEAAVPASIQRRRKTDRIPMSEPRWAGALPGLLGAWSSLKQVVSRTSG